MSSSITEYGVQGKPVTPADRPGVEGLLMMAGHHEAILRSTGHAVFANTIRDLAAAYRELEGVASERLADIVALRASVAAQPPILCYGVEQDSGLVVTYDTEEEAMKKNPGRTVHALVSAKDLPAALRVGAAQEPVWLVERGPLEGQVPHVWLTGGENWTQNPRMALRFPTKEAAQAHIATTYLAQRGSIYNITEHVFVDASPAPAAQQDELDARRYRWLRERDAADHITVECDNCETWHLSGDELDAAIDAALAAAPGPHKR